VTGVQTCALPIWEHPEMAAEIEAQIREKLGVKPAAAEA
jgi:hypothetical protein